MYNVTSWQAAAWQGGNRQHCQHVLEDKTASDQIAARETPNLAEQGHTTPCASEGLAGSQCPNGLDLTKSYCWHRHQRACLHSADRRLLATGRGRLASSSLGRHGVYIALVPFRPPLGQRTQKRGDGARLTTHS